ncbi:hypothetical protein BFW38_08800 [Terasakiispira papahanaumokuakeensis]|uniref:5-oxoprolinase (ATP-hydrolyzing) subunit A n=1 Tax=Terasakiispira papahanaumokuakeensis TaxID=197479 RepID=A0A1E2V9H8_9GAMM|nr:5-oxoprolinase subunit PxpA [Terasakiispira papahanaumokuakeensis]ODC03627.1 hypothetical protein BFW38_08800 [Terasakiispira papahanaumokuakeensis]
MQLQLNCDIGESFGAWTMGMDAEVMPYIDQANIACGFHAGDPLVMQRTVRLALTHDVTLGAHPAYPDLVGFGRRSLSCSPDEVTAMVRYQIGALMSIAAAEGGQIRYVKPHGALYNDMMRAPEILEAVLKALADLPQPLALMAMSTVDNQALRDMAASFSVPLWLEAFADRAYDEAGFLVSRREVGAVHHDQAKIVAQAQSFATGQPIQSHSGQNMLTLEVDTLCVHGDNPESIAAVRAIREALNPSALTSSLTQGDA